MTPIFAAASDKMFGVGGNYEDMKLVVENEGTEVDEDRVLLWVVTSDRVLQLIRPDESWKPAEGEYSS